MPAPPVEPTPMEPRESLRAAPLLAQEASYFAASARIASLRFKTTIVGTLHFEILRSGFEPLVRRAPTQHLYRKQVTPAAKIG